MSDTVSTVLLVAAIILLFILVGSTIVVGAYSAMQESANEEAWRQSIEARLYALEQGDKL